MEVLLMLKNKLPMKRVKSFNEFITEGEADFAKPSGGDEREKPAVDDETSKLLDVIKEKITGCITTLENLHKTLEGTKISQNKIDGVIADLTGYLQNVEDESDISNKSNQEN